MTRQACKQPNGVWLLHGAVCPERVGALKQIRIHELNLDACQVLVPADRTKTREESNRRFLVEVGAALDLYLERVRRQ